MLTLVANVLYILFIFFAAIGALNRIQIIHITMGIQIHAVLVILALWCQMCKHLNVDRISISIRFTNIYFIGMRLVNVLRVLVLHLWKNQMMVEWKDWRSLKIQMVTGSKFSTQTILRKMVINRLFNCFKMKNELTVTPNEIKNRFF